MLKFRSIKAISLVSTCCLLATPSLFAEEFIRVQYATANPEGSSHVIYINNFKRLLEKYSDGKMTMDLYINGIKGSEHDNLMDVSTGELHMSTLAVNNISPFSPSAGFMTLPYMFPKISQARKLFLTDNIIINELNRKMIKSANIRSISWLNSGYRVLTNSKRIVRKPSDLKGLKIRVPQNQLMVASYQAWGVEPIPLAWTKTYDALSNGVIDGHDNAYLGHKNIPLSNKPFYEIQKYITEIHYVLLILGHIVNEDFYQSLSPKLQNAMTRAAREATIEEWNWVDTKNIEIRQNFLKHGMIVTSPDNNEEEWIRKGRSIWPKFYDSIGGKEFVDEVVDFLEE